MSETPKKQPIDMEKLYTKDELCEFLGIGISTFKRMEEAGDLKRTPHPLAHLGIFANRALYKGSDVWDFLEKHKR